MKVKIEAKHVEAAMVEYHKRGQDLVHCCPLHQALRPYIKEEFAVGGAHVEVIDRYPPYQLNPPLNTVDLYTSLGWERALNKIEAGEIFEFEVEGL